MANFHLQQYRLTYLGDVRIPPTSFKAGGTYHDHSKTYLEQFSKVNKQKNKNLRAGRTNLPEPGQATFKIGGEAEGVNGKITGRDGGPVFGNDLFIAGVGEQIIFGNQHGLDLGPADMKP